MTKLEAGSWTCYRGHWFGRMRDGLESKSGPDMMMTYTNLKLRPRLSQETFGGKTNKQCLTKHRTMENHLTAKLREVAKQ